MKLVVSPLLDIVPTEAKISLLNAHGVIFTSANGVRHGPRASELPAYCVGPATTTEATQAGWKARQLGETADQLVEALAKKPKGFELIHICGRHTRGNVAQRLRDHELIVATLVVYDQVANPLSEEAKTLLTAEAPVLLPLFSPRTAKLFANEPQPNAELHVVALSDAVAAEIPVDRVKSVSVAPAPTVEAMRIKVLAQLEYLSWVEGRAGDE
ncbi:MAG: uroporphyrinogen-III synthase [Pseudomonadota bacterium]